MNKTLRELTEKFRELHCENNGLKEKLIEDIESDDIQDSIYQNEVRMQKLLNDIIKLRGTTESREIELNKYYRHFKGKWYYVMCLSVYCENIERTVVVYQALYGDKTIYFRDLDEFLSYIDFSKYPQYEADTYRFTCFDELAEKIGHGEAIKMMQEEIPMGV